MPAKSIRPCNNDNNNNKPCDFVTLAQPLKKHNIRISRHTHYTHTRTGEKLISREKRLAGLVINARLSFFSALRVCEEEEEEEETAAGGTLFFHFALSARARQRSRQLSSLESAPLTLFPHRIGIEMERERERKSSWRNFPLGYTARWKKSRKS